MTSIGGLKGMSSSSVHPRYKCTLDGNARQRTNTLQTRGRAGVIENDANNLHMQTGSVVLLHVNMKRLRTSWLANLGNAFSLVFAMTVRTARVRLLRPCLINSKRSWSSCRWIEGWKFFLKKGCHSIQMCFQERTRQRNHLKWIGTRLCRVWMHG